MALSYDDFIKTVAVQQNENALRFVKKYDMSCAKGNCKMIFADTFF
jgi:hypothetical protein